MSQTKCHHIYLCVTHLFGLHGSALSAACVNVLPRALTRVKRTRWSRQNKAEGQQRKEARIKINECKTPFATIPLINLLEKQQKLGRQEDKIEKLGEKLKKKMNRQQTE